MLKLSVAEKEDLQMTVAILAPAPAILIKSALETCATAGVAAFGAKAREFFDKVDKDYGAGIRVIIFPTVTYGDPVGFGRKSFSATYLRFQEATAQAMHPEPHKRPARALSPEDPDTAAHGFWEVSGLEEMPKKAPLGGMTALGKKPRCRRRSSFMGHALYP